MSPQVHNPACWTSDGHEASRVGSTPDEPRVPRRHRRGHRAARGDRRCRTWPTARTRTTSASTRRCRSSRPPSPPGRRSSRSARWPPWSVRSSACTAPSRTGPTVVNVARDRAGHRYRGRDRYGARASGRAGRRAVPAGERRPGGRADPARSTGRAARRGRPLHLGECRGRHRRRPLRGGRHAVRRPDDHRRRTGQGPRRRTRGQHRARLVPARGVRATGSRARSSPTSIARWPGRSATRIS